MDDFGAYAGLFGSALISATLLPGSSEVVLLALLASGTGDAATLVIVATVGNILGSLVNWTIGRFLSSFRDRRWFPVKPDAYDRAVAWYGRYGRWSLLMSWVTFVGEALTVAAGALRRDPWIFLLLVGTGKGAR